MPWRCKASKVCSGVHSAPSRITRVPPLNNVLNQRSWAPSKANDMKCSSRVCSSMSYSPAMAWQCMLIGPCATATPLGRPVEPEV
ncbi:hypothetical protein D3C84_1050230 [compost metagenome]